MQSLGLGEIAASESIPESPVRSTTVSRNAKHDDIICHAYNVGECSDKSCLQSHKCDLCHEYGHPKLNCRRLADELTILGL
jgi:hypothetical protein